MCNIFMYNKFYDILIVNTNTKQVYFQLQKLLTDKRLCHETNLCTLIHIHLYEPLQKKTQIPIYQDIFTYIPQVYRRFSFYIDRQ